MCGIAGLYGHSDIERIRAMTRVLAHRGPDGEYIYRDGPVALGARRLAILDPANGAQPMRNESGSVVVVYNGEIYNYPELRERLLGRGHVLETCCDTELIPHLYEDEGIRFVRRLNGIFAFALWDRRRCSLYLVRDPIGIKPLVYCWRSGSLAFGSEAKAVLVSGLVDPQLDEASLHLTMNVRYIPGERTLFAGIRRLPPGHYLEVTEGRLDVRRYCEIDFTPDESLSEADWIEGIREHLERAVHRQLLSDVPVGVALSGGVDSSAVVAMIRQRYSGELKTFTLGFNEPWDENDDARFVADAFDTNHHELTLTEPALTRLRDAIYFTEEPKVNSLQLYHLHRFIGEHVNVSLSGLGGDELFAGYDIYTYLRRSLPLRERVPRLAWKPVAPAFDAVGRLAAGLGRPSLDLYARGLEWLASVHDPARHYLLLRNVWDFNPALLRRVYTRDFLARLGERSHEAFAPHFPGADSPQNEVLRAEFRTKLVSDLLHNEDTMSMAHSVESRVPLLDLELVRFVARAPDSLRFGGGLKGLLKKALADILPPRALSKPKWGFTVDPVEQWRKDLRGMALEMLTPERLREAGIFNPRFVESVLRARPHQRLRWHYFMLWQMIGFEIWRNMFLVTPTVNVDDRPAGMVTETERT